MTGPSTTVTVGRKKYEALRRRLAELEACVTTEQTAFRRGYVMGVLAADAKHAIEAARRRESEPAS